MNAKSMSVPELIEYAMFLDREIERIKADYDRLPELRHTIVQIENELHRREYGHVG
jgi:hypothetical protein